MELPPRPPALQEGGSSFAKWTFYSSLAVTADGLLLPLIASIMSNEREWIEHTLSHAHHEPQGAPALLVRGLRWRSRQWRETNAEPCAALSLIQLVPFFSLSLSLSSHCHSANDGGRPGEEGEGRRRTSQRPFRAWLIQCALRASCVGRRRSARRHVQFGERLRFWPLQVAQPGTGSLHSTRIAF